MPLGIGAHFYLFWKITFWVRFPAVLVPKRLNARTTQTGLKTGFLGGTPSGAGSLLGGELLFPPIWTHFGGHPQPETTQNMAKWASGGQTQCPVARWRLRPAHFGKFVGPTRKPLNSQQALSPSTTTSAQWRDFLSTETRGVERAAPLPIRLRSRPTACTCTLELLKLCPHASPVPQQS